MKRQVALVLVALCALLGCVCSCTFDERAGQGPGPLMLVSALKKVGDSDPDSCRAECCGLAHCAAAVLALPQDGPAQCFLLSCEGACSLHEDNSGQYRVFTRSDAHAPDNSLHALPLMLGSGTRTGDQNNSTAGEDKGESPPIKTVRTDDSEETPETKDLSQDQYTELCAAPLVVGPCRAAFSRWFFNVSSGRCERFIYGGCRGNKNNHDSEELCTSTCARVKVQHSKKQIPVKSEDEGPCGAAPESGPCRAAFSMFYFDPESQSCKTFVYGGCRGNANRYGSERECLDRCVQGVSLEGKSRSRWTAAFFLFLALAAISFLLLTALIFITMRRNRGPQRALSIRSDKEELLPDSERSSVDSLPLPESPVQG